MMSVIAIFSTHSPLIDQVKTLFGEDFSYLNCQSLSDEDFMDKMGYLEIVVIDTDAVDDPKQMIAELKHEINWLPILAVSKFPEHDRAVELMRAGATDYINLDQLDESAAAMMLEKAESNKDGKGLYAVADYQAERGDNLIANARMDAIKEKFESIGEDFKSGPMGKVLLVDDEPAHLAATGTYIADCGFDLLSAESGQAALDLLADHQDIDVVVLDIRMPGLSGEDVLKAIQDKDYKVEVIVLTAFTDTDIPINSYKNGAVDYLNKSVRQKELVEHIGKAVLVKRSRVDEKFQIPYDLRMNYLKQFCEACQNQGRKVSNSDAIDFIEELEADIPKNEDEFDQSLLQTH